MAVGQAILVFDNVTLSDEGGKKPSQVKLVLDLTPPDNTPPKTGKATIEYPAEPFGLSTEAPTEFDKRYVLMLHEWVE